jgi:hypothetical protein
VKKENSLVVLKAVIDDRLLGKPIMVTEDGIVLVMLDGHWHTLSDDYSVRIDLAPPMPMPFVAGSVDQGYCPPAIGKRAM